MSDFISGVYQLFQVPKSGTAGEAKFVAQSGVVQSKEQLDAWYETIATSVELSENNEWAFAGKGSPMFLETLPGSPIQKKVKSEPDLEVLQGKIVTNDTQRAAYEKKVAMERYFKAIAEKEELAKAVVSLIRK